MVAALAGALYLASAARDIVLGDTPELMTAAIGLGVAHPPGYPLFTMLGHLFSLLPAGPLPFRVNLLSVVCGTGTVALVYFTALRLSGQRIASACAALVLASTPLFWTWSLVAEVFALNKVLAAAMIYLLVTWHEQPERMGWLVAASFVGGLGLANQQTMVLLGPAALYLLWRRRALLLAQPRILAISAAALLLGLLPYAYLPWAASRQPAWNWGDATSWDNFLAVVTRRHFGSGNLVNSAKFMGGSAGDRVAALVSSFGWLAGILLVLGMVQAYRRKRWYFWFSALEFAFGGVFFAAYANMNLSAQLSRFVLERFYLMSHVALAPLTVFGVLLVADLFAFAHASELVSAGVLLMVSGSILANYHEIDQSQNHLARHFAEDILASLEPGSILLVSGDEVTMPLAYLKYAEGYRPDVALVVDAFLYTDWYVPQLRRLYPNLAVPFERYDGQTGTMKALIEANPGRPVAVDGIDTEASLNEKYWFYRRGLVAVIEPLSKDVKLEEMITDTERLFGRYRLPSPGDIKAKSLEPSILSHYATPAAVVGQQCEQFQRYAEARTWYERALSLDPSLVEVRAALGRRH